MDYLIIGIFGFFIGILSGLFGFGGSSISTPILRGVLGIQPYLALASPFPMTLFSSIISVFNYQKKQLIDWRMSIKLAITVIPGSILGAYVTGFISGSALMYLTAVFLAYISIQMVRNKQVISIPHPERYILPLGFLIGFVSGMLANGGGILIVPLLLMLGVDIKRAVATSMAVVFFAVTPAIAVHWWLGHINWWISLALILGSVPGAYLGSRMVLNIDKRTLRKWYGIFVFVMAVYLALYELIFDRA